MLLLLFMWFGAIDPDDGERVWAVCELCSDLIEVGVCDLSEWASAAIRKRFSDGGVCASPDDELESSSFSLSHLYGGELTFRGTFPWI